MTGIDQKAAESASAARRVDEIHLINLDRRSDRLERFSKNHPGLAGHFKRFSAYDGKTLQLTPDLARLFAPNNFNWHQATMGCAMSHLALWQRLSQRPGENWLILEDDARLAPGWESAVESALSGSSLPADWDVFYLGGILPKYRDFFEKNVKQLGGGVARIRPDCVFGKNPPGYFHFCAYAYLLSHHGAVRVLDLVKQGGGIWMQADFLLAYTTPQLTPPRKIFFLHPVRAESFQDSEQGFAQPYGEAEEPSATMDSDIWKQMECFLPEQVASALNQSPEKDFNQALSAAVKSDTNVSAQKMGQLKLKRPDEIGEWPQGSASLETAIALSADAAYFPYTSVVILSLIENGGCVERPIFVFAEEFQETDIQKFSELSISAGCEITLIPLGGHALKELPPCGHMSRATYLRLLIPSILKDFQKILYLDSDLLVLSNLNTLLKTEIVGFPVAAVRDLIGERCCKINFFRSGEKHYFNAGVLLINTKEWIKQSISEKVIKIALNEMERQKLSAFGEQCLLNYVIKGEFLAINKQYNWATFEPRNCSPAFLQMAPTPHAPEFGDAKILHFTGHCKPWQPESSLEEISRVYLKSALKSPWFNEINNAAKRVETSKNHYFMEKVDPFELPVLPSHRQINASPEEISLIRKCQEFTMTPPEVILNAIRATQYVVERHIDGDIVECGVWRGGISMAMAMRLQTLGQYRRLYLYDTFEGMSRPSEHDVAPSGQKAEHLLNQTQRDEKNHIWAYAPLEKVRLNFLSTGYPMEKVNFVKGKVEETIPETLPDKIALLRLDTDWYESTRHELIHLYPRLVSGGVLILDDYGFWAGARKAVDNFFENINPKPILKTVYDGIANSAHWAIKP